MINMEKSGPQVYFPLIDSIRFSAIQIGIASLQLLSRTQALIILIIDVSFFSYFVVLASRARIFKKNYMMDKTVIQECCILIFLVAVTLFSFTENSGFSSSTTYKVIEIMAVVTIAGAAGFELAIGIAQTYVQLSDFVRKYKNKENANSYKKVDKKEQQGGNVDQDGGDQDDQVFQTPKSVFEDRKPIVVSSPSGRKVKTKPKKVDKDDKEAKGSLGRKLPTAKAQKKSVNTPIHFRKIRRKSNLQRMKKRGKSRIGSSNKN